MGMQPYVVKRGDYLQLLADQFAFDANTIWNDPKNSSLRDQRNDPDVLCSGDVLYIPEPEPPPATTLTVGSTNNFVSPAQLVTVNVRFTSCLCFACDGQPLKGEPYEVEGASVDPGALDDDGYFSATLPTTVQEFVVKFPNRCEMYTIKVGYLDPPDTLTGAWQRLAMLGFADSPTIEPVDGYDDGMTPQVQDALSDFQWNHSLPLTAKLDDATVAKLVERIGR